MDNKIAKDLTQGPVLYQLIRFAIPVALANAMQAMYSTVDMVVVGQFVGASGLSAVGIGGQIMGIVLCFGISFSVGAQVLISQQVGAGNDDLQSTIGTLFSLELISGILFCLLGLFFVDPILVLMNTPAEAWANTRAYTVICCCGTVFMHGYNAVCGLLRGMGDSKRPMVFIAIASLANVILDLLFVVWFHMGAAGTALATVIAQGLSLVISLIYLYRHRDQFGFDFKLSSFRIRKDRLIPICKIGIPYAFQGILISGSMMYVNAQVNSFGVIASAADSIGNKLNSIINIVVGAISMSSATMVGQCFGARKLDRVKKCFWACMVICLASWLLFTAAFLLIPKQIFGIFSTDPAVLDIAPTYLGIAVFWVLAICSMNAPFALIDGVGNAGLAFFMSVMDGVVARIGLCILLGNLWGLEGFWLGNALAGFVTTIIGMAYYLSGKWKYRKTLLGTI